MILIDKRKAAQLIVFYSSAYDASIFSLVITPETGTKETSFHLENNLSSYVERSFRYELSTDAFEGLQPGLYNYSIFTESNTLATKGKMLIVAFEEDEETITPFLDENEDDEIIFNG